MRVPSRPSTEPVFQLSVEQYHAMIEAGVITDGDPVELLEGVLVASMSKNPPHRYATRTLQKLVEAMLPAGWSYQAQDPITLEDGEPEPDGAVVRGADADYRTRHPRPAEISFVIEVADTTLSRDRGIKLRSYARAGIPIYWIVNLVDRRIEVYSQPVTDAGADPAYRRIDLFGSADQVPVVVGETPVGSIAVAQLLPE